MTDCSECKLAEHDPAYYSWKFVTPRALSDEVRALNTPDAWQTADHVHFINLNGKISYSKGLHATGSSEFLFAPAIPGLRLDIGPSHVTFSRDFTDEQMLDLHKRLSKYVAICILQRAGLVGEQWGWANQTTNMLVSGNKFAEESVRKTLKSNDEEISKFEISVMASTKKNSSNTASTTTATDAKKRKVDDDE